MSEECFGDWFETTITDMISVFSLVDKGKFAEITADKVKKIPNGAIDIFYKNWKVCGVQEAIQDGFEWCTEEVESCIYQENFMERMTQAATPLIAKTVDLISIVHTGAHCLNDT